jgi:hypothetical protein
MSETSGDDIIEHLTAARSTFLHGRVVRSTRWTANGMVENSLTIKEWSDKIPGGSAVHHVGLPSGLVMMRSSVFPLFWVGPVTD